MKFEIFAGPSLKISGGYFEISGELSFTRAIAQMLKQPFLELSLPVFFVSNHDATREESHFSIIILRQSRSLFSTFV